MAPVALEIEHLHAMLRNMLKVAHEAGPVLERLHANWLVSDRARDVMDQCTAPEFSAVPGGRLMFCGVPIQVDPWASTWDFKLVVTGVRDGTS